MNFLELIKESVEKFRKLDKSPVRIVSHLDADGITAASILIKALKRANYTFVVSVINQLSGGILDELEREDYKIIFFTDVGSSFLKEIDKRFQNKEVFILDHHKFEDSKVNLTNANPNLFGLNYNEISGAGIVYFFVKYLDERNKDLAHLALVGAIGDMQENKGFVGLNNEILDDAIEANKIEVKKGLSMFGAQSRPLYKVLEYSTEPYIPRVTGSEEGAINFLGELGINFKERGRHKKLNDLSEEEIKRLVTGIILKRLGSEEKPEDVLGYIYILKDEDEVTDAKEFSTLLNSCGRMNKSSLGIGVCLGNKKIKKEALELLNNYKKELINGLNWFYNNRRSDRVIESKNYVIINAENRIRDTLIGTLVSIISKSNLYDNGTVIIGMAYNLADEIKISARLSGFRDIDLKDIFDGIIKKIGNYDCGGHKLACGAVIPQEKEEFFIKSAVEILDKLIIEEKI